MRDTLRQAALRKRDFEKATILLDKDDPESVVELRQPSVGERSKILNASRKMVQRGKGLELSMDQALLQVKVAVCTAHDPSTGEKIFDAADEEVLLGLPAGGWIDDVWNAASAWFIDSEEGNEERKNA